jgi:hypothetical protein
MVAVTEEGAMTETGRVALVFRGDRVMRRAALVDNPRLAPVAAALSSVGLRAEAAVYGDDMADEVREQLLTVQGVLVWVDPVTGTEDRSLIDAMLREVAESGVWVSAHPDVILRMGTKEVLYTTRSLSWGMDTHLYRWPGELEAGLARRLVDGRARVLKQYRGNGGIGVWKIELVAPGPVTPDSRVLIQSARGRDGTVAETSLQEFLSRCVKYFRFAGGEGRLIDQPFVPRISEGLIRCYLVKDEVVGFCRQYAAGGHPDEPSGTDVDGAQATRVFGLPSAKTMFGPEDPLFASLRATMQEEWVPGLQQLTGVDTDSLPALWDADFLFGPKDSTHADTYVLSEINCSAVAPFPEQALPKLAQAVATHLGTA